MSFIRGIALASSVAAVACGTFVETTALNPPPHALARRSAESVEVYSSTPPPRPHVDVALFKVDQDNGLTEANTAVMLQTLRQRAAEQGCDAIFISGTSERAPIQSSGTLPQLDFGAHLMTATCILYISATASPVPTPIAPARMNVAPNEAPIAVAGVTPKPAEPKPAEPKPAEPKPTQVFR